MLRTILLFLAAVSLGAADPTLTAIFPNTGSAGDWATDVPRPMIEGQGDPHSQVWVSLFADTIPAMPMVRVAVLVNPSGHWSVPLDLAVDGHYHIQVTRDPVLEPIPRDGLHARLLTFTQTTPFQITACLPDSGLLGDRVTRPGTLSLTGSGPDLADVHASIRRIGDADWTPFGSARIEGPSWTISSAVVWPAGTYEFQAIATKDGAISESPLFTMTLDNTPAAFGPVTFLHDTGSSDQDGITTSPPFRIAGSVTPGSTVGFAILELQAETDPELPADYASFSNVEATGAFSIDTFLLISPPPILTYVLTTTAPNGSTTTLQRIFTIDTTPVPLALGSIAGAPPTEAVTVPRPTFSGTTENGASLILRITTFSGDPQDPQGGPLGETEILPFTPVPVGPGGLWSFALPVALESGTHEIHLIATRPLSGRTSSLQVPITVTLPPPVTWDQPPALVYGDGLGPAQLDATGPDGYEFTYDPPAGTVLPAGDHVLTASAVDPQTGATVSISVGLTVLPAPLVITADDVAREIGFDNPPLTATYAGFVNGEDATVLLAPVVLGTTAQVDSPIGIYPITVGGATAANYTITPLAGTLTVLPLANDDRAGAIDLDPWAGSLSTRTFGATRETGEPPHAGLSGGRSVWYRYTAPASGQFEIDTLGSDYDTLLALYTVTASGGLKKVGANDNRSSTIVQSRRLQNVTAGVTYLIAVDGKADAWGNLVLNWVLRSGSDRFLTPEDLGSAASGTVSVDNLHATSESGEPDHAGASSGHSRWFLWTAPTDGVLVIETEGSTGIDGEELDTVAALYTGEKISRLIKLSADDDDRDSLTACIGAKVIAGMVYRIAIDTSRAAATQTGTLVLTWTLRSATAN